MHSKSLVLRLFAGITIIFVVFVSIAFGFQIRTFESYYFDQKIKDIDGQYQEFMDLYRESHWTQGELERYVSYYENKNDIKMGMIDNYYSIVNEKKYVIDILGTKGRVYEVQLNNIFKQSDYLNLNAHIGDDIKVWGYLWGDEFKNITLMKLAINGEIVFDSIAPQFEERLDLDTVSGTVMRLDIPDEEDLVLGIDDSGMSQIVENYYFNNNEIDIENNSFIYTERVSGKKYIVKVFPLENSDLKSIIIMTRQQPIIEATEALNSYFPVLIIGVLIIGSVMLFIMSKVISNPLSEIEEKAQRMAQFDFNEYIEIKSNDEIGSLSRSLNQLSYNLEKTIKNLNDANDKLKNDIERERALENMRKEFIRNISHEFKTPLGVIRAFSEGIQDGVIQRDDMDYYSGIILEEVDNLEMLVNDMLELSKLQTGAYVINMETFNFNALVENIIEKDRQIAGQKDMTIAFEGCDYDEVYVDYHKIERVVRNFISNAVRYGKAGSVIQIKTGLSGKKLRFEIHNVCEPIPQEQLQKLWDKFYRVDESRSKSYGGSGLGLAIVKEILERHGCAYGVENTENGILFYFEMAKYRDVIV